MNRDGAESLSLAIIQLTYVESLELKFFSSNIGQEGVKLLSLALTQLNNWSSLKLQFKSDYIGHKGAESLTSAQKFNNFRTDISRKQTWWCWSFFPFLRIKPTQKPEKSSTSTSFWHTLKDKGSKSLFSAVGNLQNLTLINLRNWYPEIGN